MQPPRHILWDWNGTLQDDVRAAVNGINLLLRERKMPEVSIERHRELFTIPVRRYYEALGFSLEKENWDEMASQFIEAFASDPTARLFPETRPALACLSAHDVDMYVVTSGEQDRVGRLLQERGIREFFTDIVGLSDPGAGSKVARAHALMEAHRIRPADTCMIGDTSHDKEVADAVGCSCILLASGYESRQRLETLGCPVLDGIGEVPSFLGYGA